MKPIILYYSRSGNAEKLAQQIKSDLNCDMLKIVPEKAYGNYFASILRVIKEKVSKVSPKFITDIPSLASYDVILLGFPIWAQDLPSFVAEFVRQCDLQGKTVIPFATFGGTGINRAIKTLESVCKGAEIKLPFNYGMSKKDNYDEWISAIRKV